MYSRNSDKQQYSPAAQSFNRQYSTALLAIDYVVADHGVFPARFAALRGSITMREDAGDVSVMRTPGLDTASVALPAGIDLKDRAARMNEFWRALVEFQYRDVFVVALCVGEGL